MLLEKCRKDASVDRQHQGGASQSAHNMVLVQMGKQVQATVKSNVGPERATSNLVHQRRCGQPGSRASRQTRPSPSARRGDCNPSRTKCDGGSSPALPINRPCRRDGGRRDRRPRAPGRCLDSPPRRRPAGGCRPPAGSRPLSLDYATGVRDPTPLGIKPATGVFWAMANDRDELGLNMAPDFSPRSTTAALGWPYSYWRQHVDSRVRLKDPPKTISDCSASR